MFPLLALLVWRTHHSAIQPRQSRCCLFQYQSIPFHQYYLTSNENDRWKCCHGRNNHLRWSWSNDWTDGSGISHVVGFQVDFKSANWFTRSFAQQSCQYFLDSSALGAPVAFNNVMSLTLSAFYLSYFGASSLLLWRRCAGSIWMLAQVLPSEDDERLMNLPNSEGKLIWGPWNILGALGIAVNAFAWVYLLIVFVFSVWPPQIPVEPATMNYGSLVLGATIMFSVIYNRLWAFECYRGPVIEPRK